MKHYIYDDSFDGLLTALFYGYQEREEIGIFRSSLYAPTLLDTETQIPTEADKAERVYQSILQKLSQNTFENIFCLYLSELDGIGSLALKYLKLCYKYGDSINLAKHHAIISEVDSISKRVRFEAHMFRGFVRFKEIRPMLFYAKITPTYNILPLLAEHFQVRFSDQNFMIHDTKRDSVLVYNQKDLFLQNLTPNEAKVLLHTSLEDPFEALFKTYYQSTTITERINIKRRNHYMPRRYFKNLVEL